MKTMTTSLVISFATLALCGAAVAGTDKTLVSWVCLGNTTQQGGSALTIQSGDRFDGIVFGERVAGKWMAGIDSLLSPWMRHRTCQFLVVQFQSNEYTRR